MILYLPKWLWASFVSLLVFYSLNLTFKTDFLYIAQAIMTIASIYLFGRRRLSILVTSHFEEKQIRERCEKLSIKLIPKAMAELVPIENRIITKEKPS